MSGERVSARRLQQLRYELGGRDNALLRQVTELRFMTSRQIEAIHFPIDGHASPLAAARAARRTLERLTAERLLVRLERRIGGIRAGSASYVYAIGPVGERLLELPGPRRRRREPSPMFLAHTLAIARLVVDLTTASRQGDLDVVALQTEPRCWRQTTGPGGARGLLRPDLYAYVGTNEFEYRWFIEIDLGSEHLPTLLRKCRAYEAYYRSGREQAEHGVSPRVLWLMHRQERADRLRGTIERDRALTTALFAVTTIGHGIQAMTGGSS